MRRKDITGRTFGELTVLSFIERRGAHSYWDCVCSCGKKTVASNNNLSTGHTKSCGCLPRKMAKERMTTHGMSKGRFWQTYVASKARCQNVGDNRYGGRGVKCEWTSFEEFRRDMYESYLKHVSKHGEHQTTLDRIDVNGNYSKENCRWATWTEQSRNRRDNVFVEYNGESKCIAAWADSIGIKNSTLWARLNRGWSIEKALTTPKRAY